MIINTLKLLMREHNITQTQISDKTGIARPTLLSLIRNENKSIRYDVIEGICDYFDTTMDTFLLYSKAKIRIISFDYYTFTEDKEKDIEDLIFTSEVKMNGYTYTFEYELKDYKNTVLNKCDIYMRTYVDSETYHSVSNDFNVGVILNALFQLREDYTKIIEDINFALNKGPFRDEIPINIVYIFKVKDRTQISYKEIVSRIEEMSKSEKRLILNSLINDIEE